VSIAVGKKQVYNLLVLHWVRSVCFRHDHVKLHPPEIYGLQAAAIRQRLISHRPCAAERSTHCNACAMLNMAARGQEKFWRPSINMMGCQQKLRS